MLAERRTAFQIGEWTVHPELNSLTREGVERHIEPKVMKVLLALASQHNRVVSKEELISAVWPDTFVSDDVLTRCISILRRVTEDDPHTPRFIQTIPKVGYRLVAEVTELSPDHQEDPPTLTLEATPYDLAPTAPILLQGSMPPAQLSGRGRMFGVALMVAVVVAAIAGNWSYQTTAPQDRSEPGSFVRFSSPLTPESRRNLPSLPTGKGLLSSGPPRMPPRAVSSSRPSGAKRSSLSTRIQTSSSVRSGRRTGSRSLIWRDRRMLSRFTPRSSARTRLPGSCSFPRSRATGNRERSPGPHLERSLIYPDHSGIQPDSSLFELDLETLNTRSITTPPAGWEGDLNPAYSPNGKWIAFTRASETAVRDIYYMSPSDGKVRQLTHDHTNIDSLTWTSDSSSIIFSSNRGGKYALWKIGLRGKGPERLPVGTEDAYQPAVGPKPGQLTYTQGSAIWGIVRLHEVAKGASPQSEAVLTSTQQDSAPSLSPDGGLFAFQSRRSGNQEIWTASEQGDSLRQLTFMGGPLTGSPSWSHHGDRIVFDSRPDGHSHVFCVPASGGRPKQITFGDVNDITPRWSHDDQTIYFRSNRGDRWQLWRVSADGGSPQPVTTGDGIVPQESPDGKWLYYTRGDEDGIWRVSPSGGSETEVLTQPDAGFWGYWQVTSRGIFYLDRSQSSNEIRIFDPETKRTSLFAPLKQPPPPYAGITVAEEGKVVLITDQRNAGRHITLVEAQP